VVAEATQGVSGTAELSRLLLSESALMNDESKKLAALMKAAADSAAGAK
jgi:hypothetical protein